MQTQQDLLRTDIAEVRRVLEENPAAFNAMFDLTDLNRQNFVSVVADLAWRIYYDVIAVDVLLREEIPDALLAVQRTTLEALATLSYLVKHKEGEFEALVMRAFAQLKNVKLFSHQPDLVSEREALLARMPIRAVETARYRFSKRPYTWSGKSFKQLIAESDVTGYDTLYDYLSSESHSAMIGSRVQLQTKPDGTADLRFGRDFTAKDLESHANFARRALKHAFRLLWATLNGPPVRLTTEDPDLWTPKMES